MSLQGKVIALTGAASGMGLAMARYFASQGARLSLADVQEKPLKDLESELKKSGADVMTHVVDVRKRADVNNWIDTTVKKFGKLDGAVNFAGVLGTKSIGTPMDKMSDEEWDFIYGINGDGVRYCLQAQVPNMKDGGSIVNAASYAALKAGPGGSAYAVSKHAVIGMTKAVAHEVAPRQIRVNSICPGQIQTPMMKELAEIADQFDGASSDVPLKRRGEPQEIAYLVEFLLSDKSKYITGTAIPIDGGWIA